MRERRVDVTVAVGGGRTLDLAALSALVATLEGVRLVPRDAVPPPRVLLWQCGEGRDELPRCEPSTSLLLVVSSAYPPGSASTAGVFARDESADSLGAAIRQVARGQLYLSPSIARDLIQLRRAELEQAPSVGNALTDRERQILDLLAQGMSNKSIAARLYLSVRTIEGHLASLYARMGVHSRLEAVLARRRQAGPEPGR